MKKSGLKWVAKKSGFKGLWALTYLAIIFGYAYLYRYKLWEKDPDHFIVHDELNADPSDAITDLKEYFQEQINLIGKKTNFPKNSDSEKDIVEIENNFPKDLDDEKTDSDEDIVEIENNPKKDFFSSTNKSINAPLQLMLEKRDKFNQNRNDKISNQLRISSINQEIERLKYVNNDEAKKARKSKFELDLSNSKNNEDKVDVYKNYYESEKDFPKAISEFSDPEKVKKIKELETTRDGLVGINKTLSASNITLARDAVSIADSDTKEKRKEILVYMDFVFYSTGIATTTTFGEIIANSRWSRFLVSTQLIVSVFVLSNFINSLSKSIKLIQPGNGIKKEQK